MKERTRNLTVGLTVLVALVLLGAMIVIFRELPSFMRVGYGVKVSFPDARGITAGADVQMAGIRVGRVAEVALDDRENRTKGALLTLVIDRHVNVPEDANFYIGRGFVGGATVHIRRDGRRPGADRGPNWLPKDRVLTIEGAVEPGGGGLIPQDLVDDTRGAMSSVKRLADAMNDFMGPPKRPGEGETPTTPTTTTGPGQPPPAKPANLHETMARLDAALSAVSKVLGDPENQANIKDALVKFKTAAIATEEAMTKLTAMADSATETFGSISKAADSTSKQYQALGAKLTDAADRLGGVLTGMHRVVAEVESGQGTAGKLLRDPALYEGMVDAARELKSTLVQMQKFLADMQKAGIPIKVK